jgi:hypothetical protein
MKDGVNQISLRGAIQPQTNASCQDRAASRFTCPGCGKRATARSGVFCQHCRAFVHSECLLSRNELKCPVCKEAV